MNTHIDPSALVVTNNIEKSRFELVVTGKMAIAEYIELEGKIVFTHTEVPLGLEGQGIGSKLATEGLSYARQKNKIVLPLCPYIAAYIRRHPEYKDLVLPGFTY
ncbi:MAG: N-acetyltransferase [Bacteroidia bacterium]|nr:N-acetyltransferase [Bacteroidia bacterium]